MFKFVSTDVDKKISILRSKLVQDPEHYKTVKSMMKYETQMKLTESDSSNGSRTLLRLNRALGK